MSKKKNQRYHAKIRMLQHYGKQITNYDLDRMAEVYKYSTDTVVLVKQSNRVKKALIWYKGEAYPVIYDKIRKQIVTILKVEYLTPNQREVYDRFKARMLLKEARNNEQTVSNTVILDEPEMEEEIDEDIPAEEEIIEETEEEINQRLMKEAFDKIPNKF